MTSAAPPPTPAATASAPRRDAVVVEIHQDEVLTGEAVALDVQPLGYFLRALGVAIDMLVGVAILVLFSFTTTWLVGAGTLGADVIPILSIVVVVLVTVLLPTVVETVSRGRSLGKLAVGGRIVRADGGATGFRHAFIRALVGVLELWLTAGAVAGLVGAFTPRSQRLGDLMAGTYSERTRTPRLPAAAQEVPAPLAPWARTVDIGRLPDPLARRLAQFTANAAHLAPAARTRAADGLAHEAAAFVSPVPHCDPETFVRGVVAVRRERELRGLRLEQERVTALVGDAGGRRGLPTR